MITTIGYSIKNSCTDNEEGHPLNNSRAFTITSIVVQLLLVGGGLGMYFSGGSALHSALLFGSSFGLEAIMLTYVRCRARKTQDTNKGGNSNEVSKNLKISLQGDRESQIQRFTNLNKTTKNSTKITSCDFWKTYPTDDARIKLKDGTPTNGARISWNGDILIQGPQDIKLTQLLWRLISEEKITTVVRIGEDNLANGSCRCYTPKTDQPLEYPSLKISKTETENVFKLDVNETSRKVTIVPIEEWPDHKVWDPGKLLEVIKKLEQGPILAHCRGGIGRSGTLLLCRHLYQIVQKAKSEGRENLEVDPAGLVEKLRECRQSAVEESQFKMILEFVTLLIAENTIEKNINAQFSQF